MLDDLIIFAAIYLGWLLVLPPLYYFLGTIESGRSLRAFVPVIFAPILASLISLLIKVLYYQPRPFVADENIQALFAHAADGSFPSAHATVFAALAGVVWRYRPSWGPWYVVGAVLIGLARIVAGIHWWWDVAAGWLLGALVAACVIWLFGYNRRDVRT